MSDDEKWLEFRYQFIETGWFDYDRHKTIEAMQQICERVPQEVIDDLPPLTLFAPSAALFGRVFPFGGGNALFVYLAPNLERKSQREVDFTVAHEFAHVVLGHYKSDATIIPADAVVRSRGDVPSEKEANRLAESWGFPKAERNPRRHRQMVRSSGTR